MTRTLHVRLRRLLAALLAGAATPALAVDINKAPPPVAAATSGLWHVGISGFDSVLRDGHLMPAGAGGGVDIGYDIINGPALFGWAIDGRYENLRGTATCALVECATAGTFAGSLTGRIGITIGGVNSWLGNQAAFQNINGRLIQPLAPVTAFNSAAIYLKGGLDVRHLQASVAGVSQSQNDLGLVLGGGVEAPIYNSVFWNTELLWTKYKDGLCGACTLPSSQPSVWTLKTGLTYKFASFL